MNKDLDHYIKNFRGRLSKECCEQTIKELKKLNKQDWKQHSYYGVKEGFTSRDKKHELKVSHDSHITTHSLIMKELWNVISDYIKEINFKWYHSWSGYSNIRFNRYDKHNNMQLHCDHIHTLFDGKRRGIPILSIVGVLNENFEGGEWVMFENKKIELKTGDILMFPSNFLYPHGVLPITKGTRYSFVSWVW
tara:strand:- start:3061 stop:3636 length:576 start_codon:yes stop_codon:yes gene_type:complete